MEILPTGHVLVNTALYKTKDVNILFPTSIIIKRVNTANAHMLCKGCSDIVAILSKRMEKVRSFQIINEYIKANESFVIEQHSN